MRYLGPIIIVPVDLCRRSYGMMLPTARPVDVGKQSRLSYGSSVKRQETKDQVGVSVTVAGLLDCQLSPVY